MLQAGECELRWQYLASVAVTSPPFLLAKGDPVASQCGGPITFPPPPLEGFAPPIPGLGLFVYGRFNCTRSER